MVSKEMTDTPTGTGELVKRLQAFEKGRQDVIDCLENPTETLVEATAEGIYDKGWNGPPDKMPGERMKDVWRKYARAAIRALARTLTEKEPKSDR